MCKTLTLFELHTSLRPKFSSKVNSTKKRHWKEMRGTERDLIKFNLKMSNTSFSPHYISSALNQSSKCYESPDFYILDSGCVMEIELRWWKKKKKIQCLWIYLYIIRFHKTMNVKWKSLPSRMLCLLSYNCQNNTLFYFSQKGILVASDVLSHSWLIN